MPFWAGFCYHGFMNSQNKGDPCRSREVEKKLARLEVRLSERLKKLEEKPYFAEDQKLRKKEGYLRVREMEIAYVEFRTELKQLLHEVRQETPQELAGG